MHHPNSWLSEQLLQRCTYPKRPPRSLPEDEPEPDPVLVAEAPPLLPLLLLLLPPLDPYEEEPLPESLLWPLPLPELPPFPLPLDSYEEGPLPEPLPWPLGGE